MKVLLIVTTSAVGGAPKVAYDLANGLIQDGDQVAVIAPNDGMYFEMFKNITNDVWDIQLRKFRLKNLLEIRSIISKLKPDVIHTHGKAAGLYGRIAGINLAPVIHTLHGLHYKHYSPTAQFLYFRVERILTKLSKRIICVGRGELEEFTKLKLNGANKAVVIPNGVHPPRIMDSSIRNQMGLEQNIVVGCVARFNIQKGQLYLIQSWGEVIAKHPNARLVLVGDGETLGECKHVQGADHPSIIFTGAKQNGADYIAMMDIFVLPSLWEGLPLTLLEAGLLSKPVIATDVTGNRDLISNNQTGILVPDKSPTDISRAINELIGNPNKARDLGINLNQLVNAEYSVKRMVELHKELYCSAIAR